MRKVKVIWTKDAGFVDMRENYISHDLIVNLYSNKLEEDKRQEYKNFMDNARKEYFGIQMNSLIALNKILRRNKK